MKREFKSLAAGEEVRAYFSRHPRQVDFLVFSLFTLLFFSPGLAGDLMFRDLYHEFYPLRHLYLWVRAGEFPLWNPGVTLGAPLAGAVYPGLFYPLNLALFWLLPLSVETGIKIYLLLHFLLAGLGMNFFLEQLGLRRPAAWTGAAAYTFSGTMVSLHFALNLLPGLALLPATVGLMLSAGQRSSLKASLAAGLTAGLILLGGDPQGFGLTLLMGLLVGVASGAGQGSWREKFLLLFFFAAGALAFAGAELLPMLRVFAESGRREGFDLESASCWSFHPVRVAEIFLSRPFGDPWPLPRWWGGFLGERCFPLPLLLSSYAGIWTLIAVVLAGSGRGWRERRVIVLAGAGLFFLLLAFGRYFYLYKIMYEHVPFFHSFRYPEKYLAIVNFCLAALAGVGTERFLFSSAFRPAGQERGVSSFPLPLLLRLPLFALAATVAVWLLFRLAAGEIAALLAPLLTAARADGITAEAAAADLGFSLCRSGLFLAFSFLILSAGIAGRERPISYAPVLLVFLDLWQANAALVPTASRLYAQPSFFSEVLRRREDGRSGFLQLRCSAEGWPECFGPISPRIFRDPLIPPPEGLSYEELRRWERDTLKPNLGILDGLEDFAGLNVASSARFRWMWGEVVKFDTLPLFSVRYAIVPPDQLADLPGLGETVEMVESDWGAVLLEFKKVWPRAWWVSSAREVKGERALAAAFLDHDFSRAVIVELGEDAGEKVFQEPAKAAEHELQPLAVLERTPNKVMVSGTVPAPGWVVLNDAFFPGWKAEVNGEKAAISRANGLVRAVPVGAGSVEVVFSYRPPLVLAGVFLSGGALLLVGVLFLLPPAIINKIILE